MLNKDRFILNSPGVLYFSVYWSTHFFGFLCFHRSLLNFLHYPSFSVLLQALPTTLELSGHGEVFEDGENPHSGRSSESGFTEFVQYQGDGTEETDRTPHPHPTVRTSRRSSGPSQTKPLDKPVMQCCLEHFQQFLSRLITLYITPGQVDKAEGDRLAVMQSGPLVSEGSRVDHMEACSGSGLVQRECVAAFTAACQLFLECSSFPVYIAEGNLKSSPTQEEQFGK